MKYRVLLLLIGLTCLSALPLSSPPSALQVHAATRPLQAHAIPLTGSWKPTGSMLTARLGDTATLLATGPNAGKVLVVGGFTTSSNNFPDGNPSSIVSTAEIYDPTSGTWSATSSLSAPRADQTATLLNNGQVLIAGGESNLGTVLNTAELYNPVTGTWSATGNMTSARKFYMATLLASGPNAGEVLVAGGENSTGVLNTAELYNPVVGTWSATGNMTSAREFHTATLLASGPNAGDVLVVGGRNSTSGGSLATAELFNGSTWTTTASLTDARDAHTATLLNNGQVLVVGGFSSVTNSFLASAELYNGTSWTSVAPLNTARDFHTATLLHNGEVLVAGGVSNNGSNLVFLKSAELYNPGSASWSATDSLNTARGGHTATLLNNGQVLVAGGASGLNSTDALASAEVFAFAPQINLPTNITVDATGPNGATVHYTATATDPNSGHSLPITCNHASGSTFPIGTTTVTCSAKLPPPASLVTSGSFTITVEGAPVLHLPANITVDATSPHGAVVTYSATATDPNTGNPVPVTCTPASGSTFPIGTTTVQCSAQKSPTLITKGSFTVTVNGAVAQIKALIALVKSFKLPFWVQESLDTRLQAALVTAQVHLNAVAKSQLGAFIAQVQVYKTTGQISSSQASQLIAAAQQIQNVLD